MSQRLIFASNEKAGVIQRFLRSEIVVIGLNMTLAHSWHSAWVMAVFVMVGIILGLLAVVVLKKRGSALEWVWVAIPLLIVWLVLWWIK